MGSKARFAKHILPIILDGQDESQWYVEPFCGGMNMIDKVQGKRIANDNNKYLIELWKGLILDLDRPTDISKEYYSDVRTSYNENDGRYSDFIIGWVGFVASANGRFFEGGYSGVSNTKTGKVRDYIDESIRNINKQAPSLNDVIFSNVDYRELVIPYNSIIYCDIPYQGTKQYSTSKNFDHDEFWNWARNMSKYGHTVYVSEYNAPDDFICVWEKETKSSLSANGVSGGNKESVERLFTLKQQ